VHPGLGVDDIATEVVQHSEDLGEEAQAVDADELEQGGAVGVPGVAAAWEP